MKIDRVFNQGPEVYLVSENKVFRIGRTYRSFIIQSGNKAKLVEETGLKEMKGFKL